MQPCFRNEFHASVQQAPGKHTVVGGEYIWKYTHNGGIVVPHYRERSGTTST